MSIPVMRRNVWPQPAEHSMAALRLQVALLRHQNAELTAQLRVSRRLRRSLLEQMQRERAAMHAGNNS